MPQGMLDAEAGGAVTLASRNLGSISKVKHSFLYFAFKVSVKFFGKRV